MLFEEQRVRQLLMSEEMGDRRSTQFPRHLCTFSGPSVPPYFLRTLGINSQPPHIQAIIPTQAQVALDDVAQLADKKAEVTPPPCVAQVASSDTGISKLTNRIDELARQIDALSASRFRPRSPSLTQHARRTYGCIILRLDFGLRRQYSWRFVVADVTGPIIASDFLSFYNLLGDVRRQRLIDITTLTINGDSGGGRPAAKLKSSLAVHVTTPRFWTSHK